MWNDVPYGLGGQDGITNHVGIVEKVEDGIVYTIEGNFGDACRENLIPQVITRFMAMVSAVHND